ncbi:MAG: thymidylate synthase [Patescibacteria group bacterium]|nr:thymidylate synthase [Patescibacteria group bacterium]
MLYNLALNPHITDLVVWGPDKLSNTPIGLAGKQALLALWKEGIGKDSLVTEIDSAVLERILGNVSLTDISDTPKLEQAQRKSTAKGPYMEPFVFPEFIVEAPDTMPSERYTYPIREMKGADAYLTLLHTVWKYGVKTKIDAESEDVKEIRGATVVVEQENPDEFYLPDWLISAKSFGITQESLHEYYQTQFSADLYRKELFPGVFTFERPRDYAYLYAELMYAFPRLEIIDKTVQEIYENQGYVAVRTFLMNHASIPREAAKKLVARIEKTIANPEKRVPVLLEALIPRLDQIAYVIDRIKRKPMDMDKEVVLWDQRYHTGLESGRPCLFKFSFSVRNEQIDMHVFVRSHDVGRAWFFNFYGVCMLLGRIAKETGYMPGMITMESESAHIYQRDWTNVETFLRDNVIDKVPRMFFDPDRDSDPRGVVQVSVVDGKIKTKLLDTKTGKQLFEIDGKTARELLYKLRHYNLISRVDHAAFIGSELAKAEVCIKLGIEYKYDNPITLPNSEKIYS